MRIEIDDWEKLKTQEKVYYDDKHETIVFAGGLGCMHPDTVIETSSGPRTMRDINYPFFALSLFEGRVCYALSSAPYRKGEGDLLRVSHEQGEFVAHGSHRSLIFGGKCSSLESYAADPLAWPFLCALPQTNSQSCQIAPFLGVRHWTHIAPDSQFDYPGYIRFYGEQLLCALDNALGVAPLQSGAQKESFRALCFLREDVLVERELIRSHFFRIFGRLSSERSSHAWVVLSAVLEYLDMFATPSEHTIYLRQLTLQLLEQREYHWRTSSLVSENDFSSLLATKPLITSQVISIVKADREVFYDCHVFGSNLYYAEGCFHHNSGKTKLLVESAIQLTAINKDIPGGFLVPTMTDYRRDVLPEMYSVLEERLGLVEGKTFFYHKTEKTWRFAWSRAPLYCFSAERPIAGPNLGFCLINEFSLIEYERIKEMLRRVRLKDVPLKKKILAGTPEDKHGWLLEFVDLMEKEEEKRPGSFKLYQADTRENIHLDENYRAHLESMLDSRAMQVFAQGLIVSLKTNAFYYAFDRAKNVSEDAKYNPDQIVYANLDFNVGRMTATLCHKYGKVVHFFADVVLLDDSSDTHAMCKWLLARYTKSQLVLTIDASGTSRKTSGISDAGIIESYGLEVRFKRSNPRMRYRQLLVCGKLDRKEILMHPDCKLLIKDYQSVEQAPDMGKVKKDEKLTHASDSADYFIDHEYELDLDRKSSTIRL